MGWLRDLMTTSNPPVPSYGRLTELALAHSEWPSECRIKPRSLSTLFSKLDRGQDLDWLRDRPLVQRALALVLARPVGDLRAALGSLEPTLEPRFVRLRDVRYAREIDLSRDELPPGIPRIVFHPVDWVASLWLAPSGSGRSLVGAWLAQRGLARHVVLQSADDFARIPERGPVYLESEFPVPLSLLVDPRLRAFDRPVLVAAEFEDEAPTLVARGFSLVESPRPIEFLPELVDWISRYLGDEGHFDADVAERFLAKIAIPLGAVNTLGDALGWIGVLDEITPRRFAAKSLDELSEQFVRQRVREANEDTSFGPAVADRIHARLLAGAARALTLGAARLSAPRSIEEWTELLASPDEADALDAAWLSDALRAGLGERVSRRDLERAAKRLPPAAYRLARSLERAGFLVPETDPTRLRLAPHFLLTWLEARAVREALRSSPAEWGHALTTGPDAPRVLDALVDETIEGRLAPLLDLAEHFDESVPEHVAALEAAVIAAGFAALVDARVPGDLVRSLIEDGVRTIAPFPDRLEPRFLPEESSHPLWSRDAWLVAWFALSRTASPLPLAFDPAAGARLPATLATLARSIPRVPARFRDALERLLDLHGRSLGALHPGALTRFLDRLLDAAPHDGDLAPEISEHLRQGRISSLLGLARGRSVSESTVWARLWSHLESIAEPFVDVPADVVVAAFRAAPLRVLEERIRLGLPVLWSALLPHQFDGIATKGKVRLDREFCRHAPREVLLSAARTRGLEAFEANAAGALVVASKDFAPPWSRFLTSANEEDTKRLLSIERATEAQALFGLLPSEPELLLFSEGKLDVVREFLLTLIRKRWDGGEAYQLLAALDEKLLPLRLRRSSIAGLEPLEVGE